MAGVRLRDADGKPEQCGGAAGDQQYRFERAHLCGPPATTSGVAGASEGHVGATAEKPRQCSNVLRTMSSKVTLTWSRRDLFPHPSLTVQACLQAVEASSQADRATGRSRWHRAPAIRRRCASGSQGLDLPSAPRRNRITRFLGKGVPESASPSNKPEGIETLYRMTFPPIPRERCLREAHATTTLRNQVRS